MIFLGISIVLPTIVLEVIKKRMGLIEKNKIFATLEVMLEICLINLGTFMVSFMRGVQKVDIHNCSITYCIKWLIVGLFLALILILLFLYTSNNHRVTDEKGILHVTEKYYQIMDLLYCMFLYIIVLVAFSTMVEQTFFPAIVIIPIVYIVYKNRLKIKINAKTVHHFYIVIGVISTIAIYYLGYQLQVELSWDWGGVIRRAAEYVLEGKTDGIEYFYRYPNNVMIYLTEILFFRLIKVFNPAVTLEELKIFSQVISCTLILITLNIFHKTAVLIWGRTRGDIAGIVSRIYLPFYLYANFLYTDTIGIFIGQVLIYLYLKYCTQVDNKKEWYLCVIGIIGAYAYKIKVFIFFLCIAMVLDMLYRIIHKKEKMKSLFLLIVPIISFFLILKLVGGQYIDSNMKNRYEFPLNHWVAMSLDYGGYRQEDVDYTASFESYEEKKTACNELIKERIQEKGVSGTLKFIFYDKIKRTYGNSLLAGDDYASRKPIKSGMIQDILTNSGNEEEHDVCLIYSWFFHMLMLLGITISGFRTMLKYSYAGNEDDIFRFMRIAFLGVVVFLCIWECNSRYLFSFTTIMLMLSLDGWFGSQRSCAI